MSVLGNRVALLAAGTPATSATATTAFKAYGNRITLHITTVTGGAGTLTLTLKCSEDNSTYYDVYDLDSAASWTMNVNAAGNYHLSLPVGLIPGLYYKVYYACTTGAGTIAINGILWENPAGDLDVNVGDIHTDIASLSVSTATLDNAIVVDDAAFTPGTTSVMMAGAEFDDTSPDSVNEGDGGALRMSANRNLYATLRDAAGNERGANVDASNQLAVKDADAVTALQIIDDWDSVHDSAVGTDGAQIMLESKDYDGSALPNNVGTEGDAVRAAGTLYGIPYTMLVTEDGSKTPINQTSGYMDGTEQDPLDTHYTNQVVNTDTTDVAAATHYYPSATGFSMNGYKDLSFSGKIIDADGTLTLSVEAMDDEDTTSGDWIQVYGYDDKNNTVANSWAVTNGTLTFAISFNNANYQNWRVKLIASGATNTVIVKGRRKAL